MKLTEKEHKDRHILLHAYLDELIADFIQNTDKMPSETKISELMKWSFEQTGEKK